MGGESVSPIRTDVGKVQVCLVVKPVKGWEIYITSMRFVHHLQHGGEGSVRVGLARGTHIEADNTIQVGEGLDDNLPHVKVGLLEKLLHWNFFAVLRHDLELWRKSIASPKASPVCSAECYETDKTKGSLRHSGSCELLVSAGPYTSFGFCVATTPDAPQPGGARFFQGVQVKANGFKGPCWSARPTRVA